MKTRWMLMVASWLLGGPLLMSCASSGEAQRGHVTAPDHEETAQTPAGSPSSPEVVAVVGSPPCCVTSVAVGPSGGLAIGGGLQEPAEIGGQTLTPDRETDTQDGFVAMFDDAGEFQWARRFGSAEQEKVSELEFDEEGALVVAGEYGGAYTRGPHDVASTIDGHRLPVYGGGSVFLAEFSPDGSYRWSKGIGSESQGDNDYGDCLLSDLATDADGDIILAGSHLGPAPDLGAGPARVDEPESTGIFVARYATDGTHRWDWTLGSQIPEVHTRPSLEEVAVLEDRSIALSGTFQQELQLAGKRVTPPAAQLPDSGGQSLQPMLVYLSADGVPSELATFEQVPPSAAPSTTGHLAATDDRVLVTRTDHQPRTQLDFGSGRLGTPEATDLYLGRFGADGTVAGTSVGGSVGSSPVLEGRTIADSQGGVWTVGHFKGKLTFDGERTESAGHHDLFAIRWSTDGTPAALRRIGGKSDETLVDAAITPAGRPLLLVEYRDRLVHAGDTLVADDGHGYALLRLPDDWK